MSATLSQAHASAMEATAEAIQPFRGLFLQELNRQFRYNACHERGRADVYLLKLDDRTVGYGSVKGQHRDDRDTVFEFYIVPAFRRWAVQLFVTLLRQSGARLVECQSNDPLLSSMLYAMARNIRTDVMLFEDHAVTQLRVPDGRVYLRRDGCDIFEHTVEPVGEYVLEVAGDIVATGGFAGHYNLPFADLYMEVRPDIRRRGYGAYLVQELKTACYLAGRVPAARCNVQNEASRATLVRAGLRECGYMLTGEVDRIGG